MNIGIGGVTVITSVKTTAHHRREHAPGISNAIKNAKLIMTPMMIR